MVVKSENVYSDGKQDLRCDECGSLDINSDSGEYVCKACGLVLDLQKLEYHKPYREDKLQRSVLIKNSSTKIGYRHERMNSRSFKRLHRIQQVKNSEQVAQTEIHHEINRLQSTLDIKLNHAQLQKKVISIRNSLNPGTKYRNPEKLVPIAMYVFCKQNKVSINKRALLGVARVGKKDFHSFLTTILKFFPHYDEEKKRDYILQKVMKITETFELGMDFYFLSKDILYRLWNVIKNTKEDVIAGVVSSVATLCKYRDLVSVNALCKQLNIRMSTIQFQVENRIFKPTRTKGFTTLVKSADLLGQIIEKLGIPLDDDETNEENLEKIEKANSETEKVEFESEKSFEPSEPREENLGENKDNEAYPEIVLVKIRDLTQKYSLRYRTKYILGVRNSEGGIILLSGQFEYPFLFRTNSRKGVDARPVVIPEKEFIRFKNVKGPP